MFLIDIICGYRLYKRRPGKSGSNKTDPLELSTDSASFSIDGKTYVFNILNKSAVLNAEANKKIASFVDNSNYKILSDKDSVLFGRSYGLSNDALTNSIEISFFKKYNKNEMKNPSNIFTTPVDNLDLFKVGTYAFPIDYLRENAHNGTAIDVWPIGQSYSTAFMIEPTTIKQASQTDSKFELISFKKLKSGEYLLEARFNVTLFDKDEKPKKLENGYLRIRVD